MARPATVPRYVEVAEETLEELFGLDLWGDVVGDRDRSRVLVAACDAETAGDPAPEDAEAYVAFAVYDEWRDIREERAAWKARRGGGEDDVRG